MLPSDPLIKFKVVPAHIGELLLADAFGTKEIETALVATLPLIQLVASQAA